MALFALAVLAISIVVVRSERLEFSAMVAVLGTSIVIAVLAALNLAYALAERPPTNTPAAPVETAGVDLDALIRRLDNALGADGQLL